MDIATSKNDSILTIEFNRIEKKNAITASMYQTMADALNDAETDSAVRAILFSGKPAVFTAGNDLQDFLMNPPRDADAPVFRFMKALSRSSKPVVAAVAGNAVGIGTTLLLHCDLVYAAENATFSLPFSQLGLCPEFASSLLLPRLAGHQRAAEKLMLGEAFGAQEAYEMGLVSKVLPVDQLRSFAQAQAGKLVALPASSIRVTKRLMKGHDAEAVEAKMLEEIKYFGEMLLSPEAKEAMQAFFEKRKPDFTRFS
jgi:enoyl-CoA hydratase/carnithine racemase